MNSLHIYHRQEDYIYKFYRLNCIYNNIIYKIQSIFPANFTVSYIQNEKPQLKNHSSMNDTYMGYMWNGYIEIYKRA